MQISFQYIADRDTADAQTLKLLTEGQGRKVLRVSRHPARPIAGLILCFRKCKAWPTEKQAELVQSLSGGQTGIRSFSGHACHRGYYVGNNPWGKGFYKPAVYCPGCGYPMAGPTLEHVIIEPSDDRVWMASMQKDCQMGELLHEGKNHGISWEIGT